MPQSALEKDTPAEAAFPASGSSPSRGARAEDQNRRVKPRWRLQTARPDQLKNIENKKKGSAKFLPLAKQNKQRGANMTRHSKYSI
jgi:hypothetical protein